MPETPYVETEVLLMTMLGRRAGEVMLELWEHFTLNELDAFSAHLTRLNACVVHVAEHKRYATEHLPDCGEVAPPGEG